MPVVMRFFASSVIALILITASGCSATGTEQSTGGYIDSAVITTKVKSALASDDLTSLLDVEVETFRGTVQLSGFVDTEEQKERAGEIAATVDGVEQVENSLVVKPAAS